MIKQFVMEPLAIGVYIATAIILAILLDFNFDFGEGVILAFALVWLAILFIVDRIVLLRTKRTIFEHIISFENTNTDVIRKLESIGQRLESLEQSILLIDRGQRVITNLDEIYQSAIQMIKDSSRRSKEYLKIVSMQRPRGQRSGSKECEAEYFAVKDNAVISEGRLCDDLLIVHEDNPESVEELTRRLKKYREVETYRLAVYSGDPLRYQRMLIVNGQGAHLRLPTRLDNIESETAIEFTDVEIIKELEFWFDALWREAVVVKERYKSTLEPISDQRPGYQYLRGMIQSVINEIDNAEAI